jgi:ActR/RegA family two-component response regulator
MLLYGRAYYYSEKYRNKGEKEKMKKKILKRLDKKEWQEIRVLLEEPDRNITEIAKQYKIDRVTIYNYAWRRGWMEKKKKGIIKKIKELFK